MNAMLPFSFLPLNGNKSKFIDTVEKALVQDIQSPEQFGCKIFNCHTHAGSKIHFRDFVEAELLFHNSYYNCGFAYLTVQEILERKNDDADAIVLIGYETYSELYLQEVKKQLEKHFCKDKVFYCVYEAFAQNVNGIRKKSTRIRNLFYHIEEPFFTVQYGFHVFSDQEPLSFKNPLCVFIVPINTTLTTLDKMMSKFRSELMKQYHQAKMADRSSSADDQEIKKITDSINQLFMKSMKLCLITIGPELSDNSSNTNAYWESCQQNEKFYGVLASQKKKFTELGDEKIVSFAMIESQWRSVSKIKPLDEPQKQAQETCVCEYCFPDIVRKKLIDERPIFDVTRGSVVPMLQLGKNLFGEPAKSFDDPDSKQERINNLRRISVLMNHMANRHLSKGDDHFQFYFDTMGFLSDERVITGNDCIKNHLGTFLDKRIQLASDGNGDAGSGSHVVFNYIIAPRHNTNAKWVDIVHSAFIETDNLERKKQFGTVRTLYFDITKEYRSNLQAKYSDFYREIRNIVCSASYNSDKDQMIEIRFHYVDVTIASGQNFLRAADLVRSLLPIDLIEKMPKKIRISLFDSVFLLYCRSSTDSKEFYGNLFKAIGERTDLIKTSDRFYSYATINISHMRSHEDACTLCRLRNDYYHIRNECATNHLAQICDRVINTHNVAAIGDIPQIRFIPLKDTTEIDEKQNGTENQAVAFQADEEKQYLFFITHLINERLSKNRPLFENEKTKNLPIECESEESVDSIVAILDDYYNHLYVDQDRMISYSTGKKRENESEENELNQKLHNAFIKAISRPFFTFHLRKRQAAFSFCLQLLEATISGYDTCQEKDKIKIFVLTDTLVKALCDMNTYYLLRRITPTENNPISPFDELVKIAEAGDGISKEGKTKESVFTTDHYLHYIKKMLSLSQDKTKSVFLENILVNGCEDEFFGECCQESVEKTDPKKGIEAFLQSKSGCGTSNPEIKELSIQGRLYLENNKVLINALEDMQSNKENDRIFNSYFFENFYDIIKINGITEGEDEIKEVMGSFRSKYKTVLKTIEANDLADTEITDMLNSIAKRSEKRDSKVWEITTFLRDTNVTYNQQDFNRIFEFLHFSKEPFSRHKCFYHDNNFDAIRKALNDNEKSDVIFAKYNDKCNKPREFVLVRFNCGDLQEKEAAAGKLQKDTSIYIQIYGFDCFSVLDWFRLKILLTLRSKIIGLIDKKNISEYIRQKHNEAVRLALSSTKSLMHTDIVNAIMINFVDEQIGENDYPDTEYGLSPVLGIDGIDEIKRFYSRTYYKYLSVVANELIASWYRKINRTYIQNTINETDDCNKGYIHFENGQKDNLLPEFSNPGYLYSGDSGSGDKGFVDILIALFNAKEHGNLTWDFTYVFREKKQGYHTEEIAVEMTILSKNSDAKNGCIKNLKIGADVAASNCLFWIIILLIDNAYIHGKSKYVKVCFDLDKNEIRIENKVEEKEKAGFEKDELLHIMPIARRNDGKAALTLWTLNHLIKEDWIDVFHEGDNFIVVFKNMFSDDLKGIYDE